MVKRNLLAVAAAFAAAALWPLGSRDGTVAEVEALELPGAPAPTAASLVREGDRIVAVYADLSTLSLELFELPANGALPPKAPAPAFVDRIDIAASPLLPTFGAHAVAASASGDLALLYADRERDDRLLLKQVTRRAGSADWALELREPFGLPLAVLPLGQSGFAAFWSAGGRLLARLATVPLVVRPSFDLEGWPVPVAGDGAQPAGFLASDRRTGRLLEVWLPVGGPAVRQIGAAADVYAAAPAGDGQLAVATWDRERRRIMLLQTEPDGKSRETIVTSSDGVSSLGLALSSAGWIFAYDEVLPDPPGRWTHAVSLLVPEPGSGTHPRYRRLILASGPAPVKIFRICEVDGWLYVLEIRDRARLLRTRVP